MPDSLSSGDTEECSIVGGSQGSIQGSPQFDDILRIIPFNSKAKKAFHDLNVQRDTLDEHHRQYLVTTGKGVLAKENGRRARADGETTNDESEDEDEPDETIDVIQGYFRVNLECPCFSGALKWIIGRGSGKRYGPTRNVDILLAVPGSRETRGLKAAHAFLRMHPRSGVWMLYAGQEGEEKTASVQLDGKPIWHHEFHCLSQPRSLLELAGLQFQIQFAIDTPEKESRYVSCRDLKLAAENIRVPCTGISGIPFGSDVKLVSAVLRHGLGSGSFGTVFEGYDPYSGDLRAIKRLSIKTERDRRLTHDEIFAHEALNNHPGIVQLYDWCTSLGGQSMELCQYPFEVYLVQEKGVAFNRVAWSQKQSIDWGLKRNLFRQLLEGLCEIHDKEWIHRDITPMNMLFFDVESKHAAIFDFGKISFTKTARETNLAAWQYLPPEIEKDKSQVYGQKIDIWMLGLALVCCWLPELIQGLKPRLEENHTILLQRLAMENVSGISELLSKMLSWNASSRPSAQDAFTDPCLRNIAIDEAEVASGPTSPSQVSKRTKH